MLVFVLFRPASKQKTIIKSEHRLNIVQTVTGEKIILTGHAEFNYICMFVEKRSKQSRQDDVNALLQSEALEHNNIP